MTLSVYWAEPLISHVPSDHGLPVMWDLLHYVTSNSFGLRQLRPTAQLWTSFCPSWNQQLLWASEPCLLSPSLKYWLDQAPWDLADYEDMEQVSYQCACACMNLCCLFIHCCVWDCDLWCSSRVSMNRNISPWSNNLGLKHNTLALILFIYFICPREWEPLSAQDHKVEINDRL